MNVLLWCCAAPAIAQSPYQLTVTPAFGPTYPADRWVPVLIELRNDSDETIEGSVRIPVALPKVATEFRFSVDAPPKTRTSITGFVFLPNEPLAPGGTDSGAGVATVAIAEWLANDGARLARAELLGRPDSLSGDAKTGLANAPGYLLLSVNDRDTIGSRDAYRVPQLVEYLRSQSSVTFSTGESDPESLPRHVAGYDAVRAVILNGVSPEALDVSQREAVRQYLLAGGTLILPAPLDHADPTGTWIDPLMPVSIVGRREADVIAASSHPSPAVTGASLKLRGTVGICEAIDAGDSVVVLRDANYIHASFKRVGLGRVVFTSFPIAALDQEDARTRLIWRELLALDESTHDWSSSALLGERDSILESMIGAPVAPWSRAAAIAVGYVGLMLVIQLLFPSARRPIAFVVGAGAAVLICGSIFALASMRKTDSESFSAARLAVIDLSEKGGGTRREALAFFGRDDPAFSLSTSGPASLRPLIGSSESPATITQLPFQGPNAGVRSGRIDRVWETTTSVAHDRALLVEAKFTPTGVQLSIDNRLGQEVIAPVVLWNRECYRLSTLPVGQSSVALGPKNPSGDYSNVTVLAGEESAIRSRIIASTVAPGPDGYPAAIDNQRPTIVGWLDPLGSDFSRPTATFSSLPTSNRAQVLVRSAVQIVASEAGAKLQIPSEFIRMVSASGDGVFYDEAKREWLQSLQTGDWLVGFQPPRQIGKAKLSRATLSASLAAPGHKITFRRGQVAEGAAKENEQGIVVAEWEGVVGPRSVSFDLDPADADEKGCVWLRMTVEEATSNGSGDLLSQWKFNGLALELEAQVESQGR